MNDDHARREFATRQFAARQLIDLAAGELSPLAAGRLRRRIARSPQLQAEWEQTQALFAQAQKLAAAEPAQTPLPLPRWPVTDSVPKGNPMQRLLPRFALPVTALLALGVALFLPTSNWFVRGQAQVALGAGIQALSERVRGNTTPTQAPTQPSTDASVNAADALSQLGKALAEPAQKQRTLLEALTARFPDQPEIFAALLNTYPEAPAQNQLDAFLKIAAAGEKAAPENAYFPLMRAYFLLAAQRTNAAMDAVRIAGQKTRWDTYNDRMVQARWRQTAATYGETGALAKGAVRAGQLFPMLARFREVARGTQGEARRQEKKGDAHAGLQLRAALLRVGALMMNNGTTLIENLVGVAIAQIAQADTPGASPLSENIKGDERKQRVRGEFQRFARAQQETQIADFASAVNQAADHVRRITKQALTSDALMADLLASAREMGLTLLLLLNTVWTVLLGGIAFLLARTAHIRQGRPLDPAIGWGLALGVSLPALIGVGLATVMNFGMVALLVALLETAVALYFLRRDFFKNVLRTLATIVAIAGLSGIAGLLLLGPTAFTAQATQTLQAGLSGSDEQASPTASGIATVFGGAICFALPTLVLIGLAISSGRRRVPVSVGVVRGFRRVAIPMASLLLLVYAGAAMVVGGREQVRIRHQEALNQNEGQYLARSLGEPWPTVTIPAARTP